MRKLGRGWVKTDEGLAGAQGSRTELLKEEEEEDKTHHKSKVDDDSQILYKTSDLRILIPMSLENVSMVQKWKFDGNYQKWDLWIRSMLEFTVICVGHNINYCNSYQDCKLITAVNAWFIIFQQIMCSCFSLMNLFCTRNEGISSKNQILHSTLHTKFY